MWKGVLFKPGVVSSLCVSELTGNQGRERSLFTLCPSGISCSSVSSVHQCFTAMCRRNIDLLMNALLIFTFFWWACGIEGRRRQEEGGLFAPLNSFVKANLVTSSSGFFWDSWPERTWSPLKVSYFVSCLVFLKFPGWSFHLYSESGRKREENVFPVIR